MFLVDGLQWHQAGLHRYDLDIQYETYSGHTTVEPLFNEIKRRAGQFANHFRHATPETAETLLFAYAFCQNQFI